LKTYEKLAQMRPIPAYRGTMRNRLYYLNPPYFGLKTETMQLFRYTFMMDGKEVYTCYSEKERDGISDTLNRHRLDHELHIFNFDTRKTEIQKLKF